MTSLEVLRRVSRGLGFEMEELPGGMFVFTGNDSLLWTTGPIDEVLVLLAKVYAQMQINQILTIHEG